MSVSERIASKAYFSLPKVLSQVCCTSIAFPMDSHTFETAFRANQEVDITVFLVTSYWYFLCIYSNCSFIFVGSLQGLQMKSVNITTFVDRIFSTWKFCLLFFVISWLFLNVIFCDDCNWEITFTCCTGILIGLWFRGLYTPPSPAPARRKRTGRVS